MRAISVRNVPEDGSRDRSTGVLHPRFVDRDGDSHDRVVGGYEAREARDVVVQGIAPGPGIGLLCRRSLTCNTMAALLSRSGASVSMTIAGTRSPSAEN